MCSSGHDKAVRKSGGNFVWFPLAWLGFCATCWSGRINRIRRTKRK